MVAVFVDTLSGEEVLLIKKNQNRIIGLDQGKGKGKGESIEFLIPVIIFLISKCIM